MKTIVHRIPTTNLNPFLLQDVRQYLRVTDSGEDAAILQMARAAAEELEHFAQIALLTQTIRVTIFDPGCLSTSYLSLPVGPVQEGSVATITIDGAPFTDFDLCTGNRPSIRFGRSFWDMLVTRLVIEYEAGFGASASAIPFDLAQAIKDQAALVYDGRSPIEKDARTSSPQLARAGARYRGVAI